MALKVFKFCQCKSSHFVVIFDELEVLILPFLTNILVLILIWSLSELGLKPKGISIAAIILWGFFYIWGKLRYFVALLALR